jgi:hypothetical protein
MPGQDLLSEPIPKGSKEHIIVDISDRLNNLSDLTGAGVQFDTRVKDAASYIQQNIVATVIGMRAYCLVDTTLAGYVAGRFEMFVHFTNSPESPRLGPIEFLVNA